MDPDHGFFNYRSMVHEAGHALGLSEFTPVPWKIRETAHPAIPDAVMNYDKNARENYPPQSAEWSRVNDEPNCSPHPFDVMAIEALYQTIVP